VRSGLPDHPYQQELSGEISGDVES
jgi:hypothetical protein